MHRRATETISIPISLEPELIQAVFPNLKLQLISLKNGLLRSEKDQKLTSVRSSSF